MNGRRLRDIAAANGKGARHMVLAELPTGSTIGQYTLERNIGAGGMGAVYAARDAAGKQVIVKFPHISVIGDPALYQRYQRELEIGRTLHHPRLQRTLDAGDYQGHPYMVTEYIEGESLRAYLDTHAPLSVATTLRLLDELCQGVAYCHEHKVFHRDLKPENIIIDPRGDVFIIDFGIALLQGARRITWAGLTTTVGTPDYMAPEQIEGKRGDARTDIYALGAMGYEMLCGDPPFTGDNPLAVMNQHLNGSIVPLPERNAAVPATLDAVIEKALRREPEDRYQTVDEFRAALLSYITAGAAIEPARTRARLFRRRPWLRQALVILIILLAIVAIGVAAQVVHTMR